jgi:hypothetical protein
MVSLPYVFDIQSFNPNITDTYSLAVYVIFPASILIFIFGATYRIVRLILAYRRRPWIITRSRAGVKTLILGAINVYIYPPLFAIFRNRRDFILGLLAVHFIGLIPLIFLLGQHVAFFSYYIPGYHILWPFAIPLSFTTSTLEATKYIGPPSIANVDFTHSIWGPLTILLNGDVLTIIVLAAIGFKFGERLYAMIKDGHRASDTILLLHLLLIIITGAMAAHHLSLAGASVEGYRAVISTHIILVSLFLILLPYTKYWHFVFGMWFGKFVEWIDRTWMRGAALEGGRLVPARRRGRRR